MESMRPESGSAAPFARPMATGQIRRDAETPFRIAAEPEEREALARFLGVDRIDRLSFAGFVSPAPDDGWRVRGRMVARIEQSCVVTLEPVRSRVDFEVERLYLPADSLSPAREVRIGADDDDTPDPFTDSIDPAALAVETLALAIDPYPRAEGAALGQRSFGTAGAAEASGPFASLAALRDRNGDSGR